MSVVKFIRSDGGAWLAQTSGGFGTLQNYHGTLRDVVRKLSPRSTSEEVDAVVRFLQRVDRRVGE